MVAIVVDGATFDDLEKKAIVCPEPLAENATAED
jgi:hypothetical protein